MSNYLLRGLGGLRERRQSKTSEIVLRPVQNETLEDLFLKTMNEINNSYIEGTVKFIEKNYPDLDRQIDEVDKQINEIWKSCLQGETSLNDFEEALNTYQNLYLEGIDLYKSKIENEQTKV